MRCIKLARNPAGTRASRNAAYLVTAAVQAGRNLHEYTADPAQAMSGHAAMKVVDEQALACFVTATDSRVGRAVAAYSEEPTVSTSIDGLWHQAEPTARNVAPRHRLLSAGPAVLCFLGCSMGYGQPQSPTVPIYSSVSGG